MRKSYYKPQRARLDAIQAQLRADGRKALEMIANGHDIKSVLAVVGRSRARLYHAMRAADLADGSGRKIWTVDPLLL